MFSCEEVLHSPSFQIILFLKSAHVTYIFAASCLNTTHQINNLTDSMLIWTEGTTFSFSFQCLPQYVETISLLSDNVRNHWASFRSVCSRIGKLDKNMRYILVPRILKIGNFIYERRLRFDITPWSSLPIHWLKLLLSFYLPTNG